MQREVYRDTAPLIPVHWYTNIWYPLVAEYSMDKVRAYLGWVRPHAHTAFVDAMDCYRLYQLLVRASVWQRFKI